MDEKIIVYEHAQNGRLDKHLDDPTLTWTKRLKICINIANGLEFLHEGGVEKERMKHSDIKSSCILLDGDWNAKITNLELCRKELEFETMEHASDNGSLGYVDPLYQKQGFLTHWSDIYSFGIVLLEMLCGRLAWGEGCGDHSQSLGPLAQRHYAKHENLEELVFHGIKDQIVPESLRTFQKIAIQCLDDVLCPLNSSRLIRRLKKALEFQGDKQPLKYLSNIIK
ncbi:receptor-like protein kinase HERK 1 [Rutidosis leptorrhynchoides]|uniref:receptor-like protein kinase HERK 1 n=1 Tax=Rutidosis leptorrhynchoides TaxID=125765 RepID=UPI003A9926C0